MLGYCAHNRDMASKRHGNDKGDRD